MWRASRFLLGVELALDATKGGGAYSFLQASFFRMTSWQHIFTEMLGFLAGRFLFLTVGSRDDNRWRVRRARAVGGGTTVGVSNASAAETPASYPPPLHARAPQSWSFPPCGFAPTTRACVVRTIVCIPEQGKPTAWFSRLAASPVHGGAVSQTSSISKGERFRG